MHVWLIIFDTGSMSTCPRQIVMSIACNPLQTCTSTEPDQLSPFRVQLQPSLRAPFSDVNNTAFAQQHMETCWCLGRER